MYRISKTFDFCAEHALTHLRERDPDHPCARHHGHNYVVEIILEGEADDDGFVLDYRRLDPIGEFLKSCWDHRSFNPRDGESDGVSIENRPVPSTAESIAHFLYERFAPFYPQLAEVAVCETPKTRATYRPLAPFGMR